MFDKGIRILVVDDMKTMRTIVKNVLSGMGYTELVEATNGVEAFEALKSAHAAGTPFGLVVSDWNMPGGTGIELLKNVRAHAQLKDLPFLLVTAEAEGVQIKEAATYAVSGYILKPFTPDTLSASIQKAYEKHAARRVA